MRRRRWLARICILVAAVCAVGCGGGGKAARREFDVDIRAGALPADKQLIRAGQGDEIVLRWSTDEPITVHLHGYDIEKDLNSCFMKFADKCFKFIHLASRGSLCAVGRFGCKKNDGIIPPIVGEPFANQRIFNIEFLEGKELDGIDPQILEVRNFFDEAKVSPGVFNTR